MMTKQNQITVVKVAFDVSDEAVERVEKIVDDVLMRDPNWNGSQIEIERDDFTCVDCSDEVAGAVLLSKVQRAIDAEQN